MLVIRRPLLHMAIEALENQEAMKQAIYKASEEIQKILDGKDTVINCGQCHIAWQKIQDELVGVLED